MREKSSRAAGRTASSSHDTAPLRTTISPTSTVTGDVVGGLTLAEARTPVVSPACSVAGSPAGVHRASKGKAPVRSRSTVTRGPVTISRLNRSFVGPCTSRPEASMRFAARSC
jgi:hypothetical protein